MSDDITEGYLAARTDANMAGSQEYQQLIENGLDAADILTNGEKQTYPGGAPILATQGLVPTDGSQATDETPVASLQAPVEANNQQMKAPKAPVKKPAVIPGQMEMPLDQPKVETGLSTRDDKFPVNEFTQKIQKAAELGRQGKRLPNDNVVADTVMGLVRGVSMAANETMQTIEWLSGELNESAFDMRPLEKAIGDWFNVPENFRNFKAQVPMADDPKTAAGKMAEGLSQFLTGFAVAGKTLKSFKMFRQLANGNGFQNATLAALKGMLADFTVFDPHAPNMSNWLQTTAAKNAVFDYLSHKDNETELVGRLKNTVEGGILGAGLDGAVLLIKYLRGIKNAKARIEEEIETKVHEPYFKKTEDSQLVSLDSISAIRARPKGIRNARKFMELSQKGQYDKRAPISLKDNGDGSYSILDGNSTFAVAKEKGWASIPARVLTEAQFKVEDSARKAAKAAKSGGGETPASSSSSSKAIGDSSSDPTLGPPGSQASDVTSQLNTSAPPSDVGQSFANPPDPSLRVAKNFSDADAIPLTPTGKKIYHTQNSVEELEKSAINSQPDFDRVMTNMAEGVSDVEFFGSRIKGRDSLGDKFYEGLAPRNIGDYLAGRFIVDDLASLKKILGRLKENTTIVEMDDFLGWNGAPRGGYRAIHIQIKAPNGFTAEVQVQPRVVNTVQEAWHDTYKDLKAPIKTLHGQPLAPKNVRPEQIAKRIEDYKEMEAAYDEAWLKWVRANFIEYNKEAATIAATATVGSLGGLVRATSRSGASRAKGQAVAEGGHGDEQYSEADAR